MKNETKDNPHAIPLKFEDPRNNHEKAIDLRISEINLVIAQEERRGNGGDMRLDPTRQELATLQVAKALWAIFEVTRGR